jgi:phosphopantetheinyl transferase
MVRIGIAEIGDLAPAQLELLPPAERYRDFASARRRREFLSGRLLLRLMLQRRGDQAGAVAQITTTAGGKPVLAGGPAIGIAHSGGMVAACVGDGGALGIDLEQPKVPRAAAQIAERFFSREEADWLKTQPADRFLMLWVLKEAYAKARGDSIFRQLGHFRCKVIPPEIRVAGKDGSLAALALYRVAGGMMIGLAATEEPLSGVDIESWNLRSRMAAADSTVKQVGFLAS